MWILPGWYSDSFWRQNLDEVDCTLDQMEIAAEGIFLVVSVYYNPVVERGLANLTGACCLMNETSCIKRFMKKVFMFYLTNRLKKMFKVKQDNSTQLWICLNLL